MSARRIICASNIQSNMTCQYLLSVLGIINQINKDYIICSNITSTINNLEIKVKTAAFTTLLNITKLKNDAYMIDRKDSGLNLAFQCNSSCLVCTTNPDFCKYCSL
jgi:hypothetical protein